MSYYSDLLLRVLETPLEKGETVEATLAALDNADRPYCPKCKHRHNPAISCKLATQLASIQSVDFFGKD